MFVDRNLSNKRIAKNTILLYVRLIFVLFVSLYTTRVVLNVLGQEDYGINNVVAGFVTMFAFLNTAMSNGIQRFFNYERAVGGINAARSVYNHALVIQFFIAFFIVLLAETIGLWYMECCMVIPLERFYAAEWIYQLSVLSLVVVVFTAPYTAVVMSHERMGYFALVSILDAILKLVFVILLQFITIDKLIFYGFLQVIISLISFIFYYVYSRMKFEEIRFHFVIDKKTLVKMLGFSGWNLMGTFAYTIKGQGLNLLLNVFFGPIVNAARGISFQILSALQGFTANIFVSFRPQLVESYASGDFVRTRNLMYTMSKMSFYFLYMFAVPVILEIKYVLALWLGNEIPGYTVPFTILILFNTLVSNFNTPVSMVVHAIGRMRNYQLVTSVMIVLILPVSWVFLKLGANPLAVYWVSLSIVVLNQLVCLSVLKKLFEFSLREYTSCVMIPSLLVFLTVPIFPFLFYTFMESSFLRLALISLASLLSTVIFVCTVGLSKNERRVIIVYLHNVWRRIKI